MLAQRPTHRKNRWQNKPFASTCALLTTLLFSHASFAADGRADYDLDDDGLIEINDLADLDEIRNNLDGKTLYGSSAGCPNADDGTVNGGCNGFELTTDLDFDTNQDGVMDANDAYWGSGYGWSPIGSNSNRFAATFEGNGHLIRNLFINRLSSNYQGLFGYTENAVIRNVGLTGPLMSVTGYNYVGALAGQANFSEIKHVLNTGAVHGNARYVGGLVGYLSSSTLENTFNSGTVLGDENVGGLVGEVYSYSITQYSTIRNGLSTGLVNGSNTLGGLIGARNGSYMVIENSYWAIDVSGQTTSASTSEANSYVGVPLATLQCAIAANTNSSNSSCVSSDGSTEGLTDPMTLFKDWDQALLDGQSLWSFGSNTQLPALALNDKVYRDSDADSVIDDEDAFPQNPTAFNDTDADGHPDMWSLSCDANCIASSGLQLDQFPDNADVWQDEDLDGQPDSWGTGCDATCQNESALVLDAYPNDTDNDGIDDLTDTDDNNDGITDIDADSDGLVEVYNLTQLNAMRYQLDGTGLRMASGGDLEQSGCPAVIHQGVLVNSCHGYELTTDLDFDTNQDGLMDASDEFWNENGENIGEGWSPIGDFSTFNIKTSFSAIFEGNGHKILNLYINSISNDYIGLFGAIQQANIRNLELTGPLMSVTGSYSIGGLAGISISSGISSCINTGSIKGSYYAGGLVGELEHSQINNSWNVGTVQGDGAAGGLVGALSDGQIHNSWNTGAIQGDFGVGGLVGELSNAQIHNSWNIGSVQGGSESTGGLVGEFEDGEVSNSFNTGLVTGTEGYGGLIGAFLGFNPHEHLDLGGAIRNSYWAIDSSGQTNSPGQSEDHSYLGITLAILQCATEANTDSSGCIDSDSKEVLNNSVTLFNNWDPAQWDFGSATQLPALILNGNIYRDTDNDLIFDFQDAYPQVAIGELLDTDNDGAPNTCDLDCLALGMSADLDDDNDGILDTNDAFPLISIGGLLDTDNDGAPDTCDANCLALNMTADLDDDNDGVLDTVDVFPLDNTEHSDFDGDGVGDVADLDDDNDGVNDVDDPNLGEDNGKPEIINVPSIEPVAVTTENGDAFELLVDDNFLNAFTTVDAVDTEFTYEASLNGNVLTIDENDIMLIPAGRQAVQVVAIDAAGNRSEPVEMVAIVYPQVRFAQATSIIGENSTTNITVSLTGDAPDYPVVMNFAINELSDVNQADLDAGFDIQALHQVIIEASDTEVANRDGFIKIGIIDDNESENDELLFIDLVSAKLESETDDEIESLFVIDETNKQHELTVTYENLTPVVNLKLEQNGIEVANVQQDAGMVSITAIVQDGNGNDVHTLTWDLNNLGLNAPLGNTLNFSPASLPVSTYEISVIATDNGVGQLSDDAVIRFDVVAPPVVVPPEVEKPVGGDSKETEEPSSSGGSGGGAVSLWLMLLLFALVSGVGVRRANSFA